MERLPSTGVLFDESLWPLVIVRAVGELSLEQSEEFLEKSTSYLQRGERHISILDSRMTSGLNAPRRRQRHVEWLETNEPLIRRLIIGTAFVMKSPFIRLSTRALLHVKPLPVPYFIASEMREAGSWAAGRLDEEGLVSEARRVREHFGLIGARQGGATR